MQNSLELIQNERFGELECSIYRDNNSGELLFTREQIGMALEYSDPRIAIAKIHARHPDRLNQFSVQISIEKGGRTQTEYDPLGSGTKGNQKEGSNQTGYDPLGSDTRGTQSDNPLASSGTRVGLKLSSTPSNGGDARGGQSVTPLAAGDTRGYQSDNPLATKCKSRGAQTESSLSSGYGPQETVLYTRKGVFEICRWSRQPKADAFMDFVWEVTDRLMSGEVALVPSNQGNGIQSAEVNQRLGEMAAELNIINIRNATLGKVARKTL